MIDDTNGRAAKRQEEHLHIHAEDAERAKAALAAAGIWYRQTGISLAEERVLKLVATGARDEEIAAQLAVSPKTIKTHMSHLLAKIGCRNRTEAALYAIRTGLVTLEPMAEGTA